MASATLFRQAPRQLRLHAFTTPLTTPLRPRIVSVHRTTSTRPQCASRRPRAASPRRAPSVPATLAGEIKGKVAAGASRKAIELLRTAHNGDSNWGVPDAVTYRAAARAFIRADRSDLALETFRLREQESNTPDPAISAAVLRACLRATKVADIRRDARRDLELGVSQALAALLRDTKAMASAVDEEMAPAPYAMALCSVQVALLRNGGVDDAIRALQALLALGRFGKRASTQVSEYNELVRQYGKVRRLEGVFGALDAMRAAQVPATHETYEFLANAAVRSVEFVTGAVSMETLPAAMGAEVAFCGRSNVGKSSLVNMLVNRRALARVSGTPGKTQQFNYFLVNGADDQAAYYLVDLPGVGYARVPKEVRDTWLQFMRLYFTRRLSLRVVFHLVDGRHGPLADDIELMRLIAHNGYQGEYVVVLTKMDKMDKQKVKGAILAKVKHALMENGCKPDTPIVVTSAATKLGRDELWRFLRYALRDSMPPLLKSSV